LRVLRIDDFDDAGPLGTDGGGSEIVVVEEDVPVLFGGVGPGFTAEAGFEAVPCMGTMPCSRAASASRPSNLRPGFLNGDVCGVVVVVRLVVAVRESVLGLLWPRERNLE
jgi:hypothetical protein